MANFAFSPVNSGIGEFYKVSYMWYTTIAVLTTLLVGLIVSCITGRVILIKLFYIIISHYSWAYIAILKYNFCSLQNHMLNFIGYVHLTSVD